MNNFVWTNFGKLVKVTKSSTVVSIENERGLVLKMSLNQYKETAINVCQKAQQLKGKVVIVRTSQNTGKWDSKEWFSDLEIKQSAHVKSMQSDLNVDSATPSLKTRCLSCEGKGFYIYAGGLKSNTCSNCEGTGVRADVRFKNDNSFASYESLENSCGSTTIHTGDYESYVDDGLGDLQSESYVEGDLDDQQSSSYGDDADSSYYESEY